MSLLCLSMEITELCGFLRPAWWLWGVSSFGNKCQAIYSNLLPIISQRVWNETHVFKSRTVTRIKQNNVMVFRPSTPASTGLLFCLDGFLCWAFALIYWMFKRPSKGKGCLGTLDESKRVRRGRLMWIVGILVTRVIGVVSVFLTRAQSRVCDGGVQMVISCNV